MNKLYVPTIGGIETWVQQIAEGLNGRTDMRVLVCQEKGVALEEIYNGVKVIRAKSYGKLFSLPISIDFFWKFCELSKQTDIIQIHEPFPLIDLAVWLFRPKAKMVVWWHSDIVRQKVFGKLVAPFIRHTLRQADMVIAATQGHIKSSDYLPERTKVIPFGLNFAEYPAQEGKHYLKLSNARNKKLLFVGRLVYYKGIQVLLKSIEKVDGAELFIVGDGPLADEVKKAISHSSLTESSELVVGSKIHWICSLSREELLAAFYDCDIFVLPSVANSEAFGIVQLEAMYYGKPVINTKLPTGVPYVSIDGETGITVGVGDAEALAGAIVKLVHDDGLREMYGRNAAKRVREHYERGAVLDRLYEEYEVLLSK
ncbi:MAG: glycosyltransferase [Clostridiales bacterium]|nr:glycosyltransferase [Clostridiales bacterium]